MVAVGSLMNDLIGSQLLISIVYSGWFSLKITHVLNYCNDTEFSVQILCLPIAIYCFSVSLSSLVVSVLRIFWYLLDTC